MRTKVDADGNLIENGILLKPTEDLPEEIDSALIPAEDNSKEVGPIGVAKQPAKDAPKDSTGGSGENKQAKGRRDMFGTKISRGKKKHKVTFKDQVGKGKVAKVYMVESYKKYNVETTTST